MTKITFSPSRLCTMDQSFRRYDVLQRNLRVLNQKEERDLQQKLNMLDKQYRHTRKILRQRTDSLLKQQRQVTIVKVCEPKATVGIAMKEIGEHNDAEMHLRGIQTLEGRRSYSSKSQYPIQESEPVEQSRSISAPPLSAKPASSVRHTGNIQSRLSLMQMKNIATIDSISEKELARQQQKAREELERLRQLQREALHKRVTAFIEKLRDKSNMQLHVEPP